MPWLKHGGPWNSGCNVCQWCPSMVVATTCSWSNHTWPPSMGPMHHPGFVALDLWGPWIVGGHWRYVTPRQAWGWDNQRPEGGLSLHSYLHRGSLARPVMSTGSSSWTSWHAWGAPCLVPGMTMLWSPSGVWWEDTRRVQNRVGRRWHGSPQQ